MIYRLLRSIIFRLDPETAHNLTLLLMQRLGGFPPACTLLQSWFRTPSKPVEAFGLKFKNPVGLAAGYDKDAIAIRALAALGFGHIEFGTVTNLPQEGNPKPRLFRLVEDGAIINRMGFPGKGAECVARSLETTLHCGTILGANLGKNKDTPLEQAASDYISLMRTFAPLADYLAVNVSSPNTVGLRRLQGREMLTGLLRALAEARSTLPLRRPILVKLAPDLSDRELDQALEAILEAGMDGIIATNTSLGREGLRARARHESGGLSGEPLRLRSETVLRFVLRRLDGQIPVVSVGGIMSAEDAKRRLEMGAALVQVYTGLIYNGPGFIQSLIRAI